MDRIWHRPAWIRPLLALLSRCSILVPDTGSDVAAELVVAAGRDRRGRPRQVWRRRFAVGRRRRSFDGVMVYDAARRSVVERLGPAGLIRVPWRMEVLAAGGLGIRSDGIWLGPFRLPRVVGVDVIATERALDARTIHVQLTVTHSLLGPVFGYEGRFEARREALP
jgi:hypothetical protein